MHAYIKSSGFIGGKVPRSLKNVILPDKGQSVNLNFDYKPQFSRLGTQVPASHVLCSVKCLCWCNE